MASRDEIEGFGEEYFEDEFSVSRQGVNERDTLRERLNPSEELKKFKYSLMGAYESVKREPDGRGGFYEVVTVKRMKNFKPMLNKQGVEEVTDYVKDLVNSHTLQSNLMNIEDYNTAMRFTLNRMMVNFLCKREFWGFVDGVPMSFTDLVFIYYKAKNLIKFVLRRPIGNKERDALTETVRETRTGSPVVSVDKPNILQSIAGSFK